jgi:uncharacterized protein YjbJ (UPF0337 family)
MDENRIEGSARDIGGKLQDAVGGLTGDTSTQVRGKANQVAGQAQATYDKLADQLQEMTQDQPMTVLISTLGIGLLFGFLLGRR